MPQIGGKIRAKDVAVSEVMHHFLMRFQSKTRAQCRYRGF